MSETKLILYHCLPVPRGDWTDNFQFHSIQMVLLHNIFIRSFNSMIYYSGEVQPGTKRFTHFLTYCDTMIRYLHHHHRLEETYWFPFLQEKIGKEAMDNNLHDHTEVMAKFSVFEDVVKSVRADQSTFDLTIFRDAIHGFMPRLIEHLRSEPDTFRPATLRKYITQEELDAHDKVSFKAIIASFSLVDDTPLFFINGDGKHSPWYPPLPTLIKVLVKHILYHFHSGVWAFGSTNKNLHIKPQFAFYEPDLEPEVSR